MSLFSVLTFTNFSIASFLGLASEQEINALSAISQAAAAFLSVLALLVSLWVFARQLRLNRWQLRLHREDHIIEWSRSCLNLLAEVEERTNTALEQQDAMQDVFTNDHYIMLRSRLSALIDEGRLYFPNIQDPSKGAQKDLAYRGSRQPILDTLVAVYDTLKAIKLSNGPHSSAELITSINKLRRQFVSETQSTIDPRTFNKVRA